MGDWADDEDRWRTQNDPDYPGYKEMTRPLDAGEEARIREWATNHSEPFLFPVQDFRRLIATLDSERTRWAERLDDERKTSAKMIGRLGARIAALEGQVVALHRGWQEASARESDLRMDATQETIERVYPAARSEIRPERCDGCTGPHPLHNQADCLRCTCEWQNGVDTRPSHVIPEER